MCQVRDSNSATALLAGGADAELTLLAWHGYLLEMV